MVYMLARYQPSASIMWSEVGEFMRRCSLPRALARLSLLLGALCGCTQARYQNVTHPGFGDAEYKNDLAQCRRENSSVVTIQGYDVQERVVVDEAKATACMSARGWQKAGA
jgi:hypothetical protein